MTWTHSAKSLVLRVQKLAGQRGEDVVAHEMVKGMPMGLKRCAKKEPF